MSASAGPAAPAAADPPAPLAFPRAEALLARVLRGSLVAQVVYLYAVTRLLTAVMLAIVAPSQEPAGMTDGLRVGYFGFTRLWDGEWYGRIATDGYPSELPRDDNGSVQQNPWAFYPLYPLLSRVVMTLTGASFPVVGSMLALLAGFGAAVLMALLLREPLGRVGALLTVTLYAVFPSSPALQVCYTESFAMLLLCGYLLALRRERWLVATGLALLIGLTRPIALPLGVVTLVALWLRWRRRHTSPIAASEAASALAALVGCGVAGLLWPAIAWLGTGERNAYLETMGAWSYGGQVRIFEPWLTIPPYYLGDWALPALVALIAVLIAGVAGPWARRLGAELRTWPLVYAAYVMAAQTPGTSTPRYLLPMFPYLAVLLGLAGERGRGRWLPTMLRFAVLVPLALWWQWKWISVLWHFTPPTDWAP